MFRGSFGAVVALAALPMATTATDVRMSVGSLEFGSLVPKKSGTLAGQATLNHILQAGHPAPDPGSGIISDSPDLRIDLNTTTSPFAGVGSIFADNDPSDPLGIICTATPISKDQVITAAHCFDLSGADGRSDVLPQNAQFILNFGGDLTHVIPAESIWIHPDYHGSQGLAVADDIAIMKLSQPLPDGVPIYPLANPDWLAISPVILAGYGESGDGVDGYYVDPEFNVKRTGANLLEYAELDDEGGSQIEVVAWDFEYEGDPDRYDVFGIPFALPNDLESMLGGGDSGGPGFLLNPDDDTDLTLYLAIINTFSFWYDGVPDHDVEGKFGSGSGGVWLNAEYQAWLRTVPEASTWCAAGALSAILLSTALRRRRARDSRP